MSKYKIERNIPLPQEGWRMYPLKEMEVGDSFFVAYEELKKRKILPSSVGSVIRQFGVAHNVKFSIRKMQTGIRVWRIPNEGIKKYD